MVQVVLTAVSLEPPIGQKPRPNLAVNTDAHRLGLARAVLAGYLSSRTAASEKVDRLLRVELRPSTIKALAFRLDRR
jgi:hypothetical protein